MRSIALVLVLSGLASTASARNEFITTLNGHRLAGSRICFGRAGDDSDYFAKFIGDGSDLVCLPADHVLELPLGNWNFFAVHPDGYVSVHPDHVSVLKTTDDYHAVEIGMVPAGRLDLSAIIQGLDAATEAVVYFPNEARPDSPSTIRRLEKGRTEVLVPAGADVVPMLLQGHVPIAVGDPVRVAAGERKHLPIIPTRTTVVVPIRLMLEDDLWLSHRIGTFTISATSGQGQPLAPVLSLRTGTSVERTLLILRPTDSALVHASLAGPLWRPAALDVQPVAGRVVTAPDWLRGIPASQVSLSWELNPTAAAVRNRNPQCALTIAPATVRLLRCTSDPAACTAVKELADANESGTLSADSLEPGTYATEVSFPPFPLSRSTVNVSPAERKEIVERIGGDIVSGRVTRGGAPVAAAVVQLAGIEVGTSDLDGGYALPVENDLPLVPIGVHACDDSFTFTTVPSQPVPAGSTFDIEIPDNRLAIAIVDARTQEPVPHARLVYGAISPEDPEGDIFSNDAQADAAGNVSLGPLLTTHPLRLCAELPGYHQACVGPVQLATAGVTKRRIEMKSYGRTGTIVAAGRLTAASAYWVSRSGIVQEEIYRINPDDGRFWYDYAPRPGDYLVVVSRSHPLFVYRPRTYDDDLTVSVPPPSPPVTVQISATYPRASATISIAIDGYLVPSSIFSQYARWHGFDEVERGTTYELRDLVLDGPLTVLLGPSFRDRPADLSPDADLFAVPQYTGLVDRRSVGLGRAVVY